MSESQQLAEDYIGYLQTGREINTAVAKALGTFGQSIQRKWNGGKGQYNYWLMEEVTAEVLEQQRAAVETALGIPVTAKHNGRIPTLTCDVN